MLGLEQVLPLNATWCIDVGSSHDGSFVSVRPL